MPQKASRAPLGAHRPLRRGDQGWPVALDRMSHPPLLLYTIGSFPGPLSAIAVVGSRRASVDGLRAAHRLGRELAEAGWTVVSGLARGIDTAALEGSLAGGGAAGVFLGNGLPQIYPPENQDLAARICRAGGFVASEWGRGEAPLKHHFPRRNRLISGISRAVVVVEATVRSGSMWTVYWALEQGKEVMAYPGSVSGPGHGGCHALIRDGALLVTGAQEVIEAVSNLPDDPPIVS